MKKAKIVLSVIAIFAIVGGAFAFKAQKFGALIYTGVAGNCSVTVHNKTLTTGTNPALTIFASTTTTDACDVTYTTTLN